MRNISKEYDDTLKKYKTETIRQYCEGISGITQTLKSSVFIFHSFYIQCKLGKKVTKDLNMIQKVN